MQNRTIVMIVVVCAIIARSTVATPFEEPGQGLNYARCGTNADCFGDRECYNSNGVEGDKNCFEDNTDCYCVPKKFERCVQDSDCAFGEQCSYSAFHPLHCTIYDGYSSDSEISIIPDFCAEPSLGPTNRATDKIESHVRQAEEEEENNGLTYDICARSSDCQGERLCVKRGSDDLSCCDTTSGFACTCMPPQLTFCENNDDCPDPNERCFRTSVDPPRCVSTTAEDTAFEGRPLQDGSSSGLPVCIASVHLQHVPRDSLVFERHVPARVLCDEFDSCATAGHMVVFRDTAMTMSAYCKSIQNGCTVQQMTVNSPVFKKRTRIPSRTKSLYFTAFAAAYESRIEEHVLKTLIHIGL